jgi:gentisate 1,2-dioxygenase
VQGTVPVSVPAGLKLTNTTAERVPVTFDVSQTLNTNGGSILAYTASYYNRVARTASTVTLVAPAANVNGVVLQRYNLSYQSTTGSNITLLAKSSTPTGPYDGDVLDYVNPGSGGQVVTLKSDMAQGLMRIPPGRGLYLYSDGTTTSTVENIFVQVL